MSSPGAKTVALAYGACCHVLFTVGVGLMAWSLYGGMQGGAGRLHGAAAWAADALLLLQFPVVHSLLLSPRGRRMLARLAPAPHGADLTSTTYVIVASAQLAATFALWSPSGVVWWAAAGTSRAALTAAYAAGWLLLGRAMYDAGLSIQAGYLGWTSVFRGEAPDYGRLRTGGLFRLCRQPVYMAFAAILWTVPVWSPDGLSIALTWTGYCLLGPIRKEARYARHFGDAFEGYRRRVPYWLPLGALGRARPVTAAGTATAPEGR